MEEGDEHEAQRDDKAEAGLEEDVQSKVLYLFIYSFTPLCSPQVVMCAPAQSAASAAEDQTSTSGHRSAPANERDRVAAIHQRLLDAWQKQNPDKDPTKAAAWFRLLEQAKEEEAASRPAKRTRQATRRPGFLAWGDS